MRTLLLGTASGCLVIDTRGGRRQEREGAAVHALASAPDGCLAILDSRALYRRSPDGSWTLCAHGDLDLTAAAHAGARELVGSIGDARLFAIEEDRFLPLRGIDEMRGRETWFGEGPPLHVRSIAAHGKTLLAAVHVGGIPRSTDGGVTWAPTIPIDWDVHEVRFHPEGRVAAAATALGLAISMDAGESWELFSDGPEVVDALAVAVLPEHVLFSVQDGPFAARSQIWRWDLGADTIRQERDGLPEWLDGKVDTAHIATSGGCAAIVDGGGTLWVRENDRWERVASELGYVSCVAFG